MAVRLGHTVPGSMPGLSLNGDLMSTDGSLASSSDFGAQDTLQSLTRALEASCNAADIHGACYLKSDDVQALRTVLDNDLISFKSVLGVLHRSIASDVPSATTAIRRAVSHIDIAGMGERDGSKNLFQDSEHPTLEQVATPRTQVRESSFLTEASLNHQRPPSRDKSNTVDSLARLGDRPSTSGRRNSWAGKDMEKVLPMDFRQQMALDNMQSPLEKAVLLLKQLKSQRADTRSDPAFDYIQRVLVSNNTNALAPQVSAPSADSQEYVFLKFTGVLKPEQNTELFRTEIPADLGGLWLAKKGREDAPKVMPQLDVATESKVLAEFDRINEIDFDVFKIADWTGGQPLLSVMYELFRFYDLFSTLNLDPAIFYNFITTIERGYRPENPYHCSTHAADVVQTAHHFVQGGVGEHLSDIDIFTSLLSAAIHDYDHPGRNNIFQLKTSSPLALMYNDKAILENHHLAASFKVMSDDASCDILSCLDAKTRAKVRENVIACVLATDLSQHFGLVSQFKGRAEQLKATIANPDQSLEPADRQSIQVMMMKAADISNPVKNPSLYLKWTERVMEEFYRQGDDEVALGMDISPFCDRKNPTVSKCQTGFINFIVNPLYSAFAEVFPFVDARVKQLESNKNMWAQLDTNRGHYQKAGTTNPGARPSTREGRAIGSIGSPRRAKVERLNSNGSSGPLNSTTNLNSTTRAIAASPRGSQSSIGRTPPRPGLGTG